MDCDKYMYPLNELCIIFSLLTSFTFTLKHCLNHLSFIWDPLLCGKYKKEWC